MPSTTSQPTRRELRNARPDSSIATSEAAASRREAVSTERQHSRLKVVVTLGISGLMGFTTVVPAYADSSTTAELSTVAIAQTGSQTVLVSDSDDPDLDRSGIDTKKKAVVAAATTTTDTTTGSSSTTTSYSTADIPDIPKDGSVASFIKAALAQLGDRQDCTALVERSLRAIGYTVGDLAPMSFGRYGHQVSKASAQAGDIMMRSGHVAIYLGDGKAVQGGYYGYTTVVATDSPNNYSVIIRLGK